MPAHKSTKPTAMQERAYEAVMRLGTQAAAAREIGTYQGTIRGAVLRYCEITGTPLPPSMAAGTRPVSAAAVLRATPERLDSIEADLAAVRADLATLVGLVGSFVHRQPVVLGTVGPNRRKADGGEGGKREARAIRRAVAG